MESRLKALKVVDLKEILQKASISIPAKANKPDLIAKITASPEATKVFTQLHPSASGVGTSVPAKAAPVQLAGTNEDLLLAPPEDIDWNADDTVSPTTTKLPPKETAKAALATKPSVSALTAPSTSTTLDEPPAPAAVAGTKPAANDSEEEKRRKRAERFGIPIVQTPAPKNVVSGKPNKNPDQNSKPASSLPDDPDKMKARAARFGTETKPSEGAQKPQTKSNSSQKRGAPAEEVDTAEQERRKKRAERFGQSQ